MYFISGADRYLSIKDGSMLISLNSLAVGGSYNVQTTQLATLER